MAPEGYEKIRDDLISKGVPSDEAKEQAAKIWNKKHPKNPVTRKKHSETIKGIADGRANRILQDS
uniref:Uncharacterized protein n=1 Tax=viral metagenome TaxID=1070528 RepID=A0A6M3JXG3_9ZZZZ